ncbi:ATP-binding protein [Klebsiella pneumoniae]|uniref:ATP-dependent nuclease n=3 Tax=Klebsiella pneumoniae TaxID=573 RepID=UPI0012BA977F|nr:AAA family ATPase [Klebsiella pneumoniae]HDS4697798.1 ATP-binding protein [Klebsiella pneumoniae subsp. pneumoniae]MBD7682345.1 ATP-binding protein [Klebsiella pneumoniae]MBG1935210.1 ATP-binding protein [Klebsiella pneumoniae]MTF46869.1 AAA family ATPase [Klebsiella pneumoniae]HBR7625391.1 ATP-binding protein [Klebsiella pneumoniae]
MDLMKIKINNIKNIKNADIELPIEGGLYSLVGGNGCGKSTLMLIMSVLLSSKRFNMLQDEDFDDNSTIDVTISADDYEESNHWFVKKRQRNNENMWWCSSRPLSYKGVYEGSLFYGTRFRDSTIVDKLLRNNQIKDDQIVDAFDYVKNNLSYILHGDFNHYKDMKKIKNKNISENFELSNLPYFMTTQKGDLLSQYRMSSGECLLISLLNYIYHTLINQGKNRSITDRTFFILIDEIELALHPIAISRLIGYLNSLLESYPKLCVYLTSHSPEVIRALKPQNMYLINNNEGTLELVNPCFPSYAIREVYRHDGFDYLILAEDVLASLVIDSVLSDTGLKNSRLIHISPVGGWQNVLNLHMDLLRNNVIGVNKQIISILDGDVITDVSKKDEYKNLAKLFLPIQSIEKFIFSIVFNKESERLRKTINDKYFTIKSLDDLAAEHHKQYPGSPKNPDKLFYFRVKKDLESRNINESYFIRNLSEDIKREVDFTAFGSQLQRLLS